MKALAIAIVLALSMTGCANSPFTKQQCKDMLDGVNVPILPLGCELILEPDTPSEPEG